MDDSFGDEWNVVSLALGTDWIFPMGFGLNRLECFVKLFLGETVVFAFHEGSKIPKLYKKSSVLNDVGILWEHRLKEDNLESGFFHGMVS